MGLPRQSISSPSHSPQGMPSTWKPRAAPGSHDECLSSLGRRVTWARGPSPSPGPRRGGAWRLPRKCLSSADSCWHSGGRSEEDGAAAGSRSWRRGCGSWRGCRRGRQVGVRNWVGAAADDDTVRRPQQRRAVLTGYGRFASPSSVFLWNRAAGEGFCSGDRGRWGPGAPGLGSKVARRGWANVEPRPLAAGVSPFPGLSGLNQGVGGEALKYLCTKQEELFPRYMCVCLLSF